ncbi:MAG: cytochrome c [Candidatus Acidiferrales bacterium]|jgi:mono/diheme cytochrome c family protein
MRSAKAALLFLCSLTIPATALAAPDASQVERGHKVYDKWCFPCHGTGSGKPGTASLAARGQKPAVLEERTDLTAPAIKTFVRHGVLFMPMFRKTEISDAELDAVCAYLTRNNKPQ